MPGPVVYSLTELTGRRRNENRRTVILTVEVKRRTFLVACVAFIASAPVTGLVAAFAGVYALFVPPAAVAAGLWLWDSRQRKGLKLHNYQAIIDSRRSQNGVLYAAGRPIPRAQLIMHQRQFVPKLPGQPEAVVKAANILRKNARLKVRGRRPSLSSRLPE